MINHTNRKMKLENRIARLEKLLKNEVCASRSSGARRKFESIDDDCEQLRRLIQREANAIGVSLGYLDVNPESWDSENPGTTIEVNMADESDEEYADDWELNDETCIVDPVSNGYNVVCKFSNFAEGKLGVFRSLKDVAKAIIKNHNGN